MITRNINFLMFILLIAPYLLPGQELVEMKGVVRDQETQEPLIGANVLIDSQGATTDVNGRFSLSLSPASYELRISYIGYSTYLQAVDLSAGDSVDLTINLEPESTVLKTATITTGKYRKPLGEVTVSLEVLQPRLIENTNKTSLDQAVEKVPGVRVIDGQANIRGGSGFSQGAGSRVLLLLNDVPILQADAGFPNWSDIPIEIIDQVEVVKGAASSLYGSSAMNGIINVRTTYAGSDPVTKASVFGTTFFAPQDKRLKWWDAAPYNAGASFTHKQRFDQLDLVLGGYYFNEESYNKEAHLKYGRFSWSTRYRITDRLAVGLNGTINKGNRNSFFYWSSDTTAYIGQPGTFSQNDRFRTNLDPFVTYFDQAGNRHRLLGRIYRVDNNITEGRANESWQYYGEYQFQRQFTGLDLVTTAGFVYTGAGISAELYGDTTFTSRNFAGYVQLDKKFFDKLNLSAGFRYENNLLINPGFEFERGVVEPSEEREAKPVFRFGANYQAFEYTYLRGAYGQGYRFPTIAEKFIVTDVGGFFVEPNPELQSETGWSAELGIKQGFKISSFEGFLDISAFLYKYEDMMEYNLVRSGFAGGQAAFRSTNIGGTTIKGYEVTIAGRGNFFGLPTNILAGYTFIDPTFDEFDPNFEGLPETQGQINAANSSLDENFLKYRSGHLVKVDLESQWKSFSFGLESFYASDMEAIDAIFNIIVPGLRRFREENDQGYNIYNFRAAYRFADHYKLSLILNNAFNLEYSVRPGLMDAPRNLTARFDVEF